MLSQNNANHRQEILADMWAQGEALRLWRNFQTAGWSPEYRSISPPLLFLLLFFIVLVLCLCFPLLLSCFIQPMLLTASRRTSPASVRGSERLWLCYLFCWDQPFITHMEDWLWVRELPGLVAGSLDLSISICLLLFHSAAASLSSTLSPTHSLTHLSCSC